ncbi:MAG: hypothetical protein HZB51_24590 [Chloroflexi bacterium]|nr:hypothetical protein [Chloroflexota bacterium]
MDGTPFSPNFNWDERRRVLLVFLDGWVIGKPVSSTEKHIPLYRLESEFHRLKPLL